MFIHVLFMFPETAGKTLEEVELMFTDPKGIPYVGTPARKTRVDRKRTLDVERHGSLATEGSEETKVGGEKGEVRGPMGAAARLNAAGLGVSRESWAKTAVAKTSDAAKLSRSVFTPISRGDDNRSVRLNRARDFPIAVRIAAAVCASSRWPTVRPRATARARSTC